MQKTATRKTTRLRQLIERPELFILTGGANASEAKLAEAIGYEACYCSAGTPLMLTTGIPDAGLTTMTEVVTHIGYAAQAVDIPLVADADTGYGNALNVRRTVQEFIRAGVAGIHLEDQVSPKRCGLVAGVQVIPVDEAVSKYRAAVDARNELDEDFIIIARTDARSAAVGGGLDEAIRRGQAYRKAGADVVMVTFLKSMDEVKRCVEEIDAPIYLNLMSIADLPSQQEMQDLGISCVYYPGLQRTVMYRINWEYHHDIKERGPEALKEWAAWEARYSWKYPAPPHFFDMIGFPEIREWEKKYLSAEEVEKYAKSLGHYYTPGGVDNVPF